MQRCSRGLIHLAVVDQAVVDQAVVDQAVVDQTVVDQIVETADRRVANAENFWQACATR